MAFWAPGRRRRISLLHASLVREAKTDLPETDDGSRAPQAPLLTAEGIERAPAFSWLFLPEKTLPFAGAGFSVLLAFGMTENTMNRA